MAGPSFASLMGPLYVLVCFALILYGILTAQVYFYWKAYQDDPRRMKCFVYLIWTLETLHSAFCIHMMYYYLVDQADVERIAWSAVTTVFLEIIIVSLTQAFYIYRIWKLSQRSFWVAAVPAFALFLRVVLGFVAASLLYAYHTWSAFGRRKGTVITLNVALSCGGLVDLITTVLLAYYLYNRRTRFTQSQHIVDTLMYYGMNTGALTMVCSMCILFTYNLVDTSLFWAGLVEIVSKLYANSMLVMLNARHSMRTHSDQGPGTIPLNVWSGRHERQNRPVQDGVHVNIFKEVTVTDSNETDVAQVTATDRGCSPEKPAYGLTP